MHEEGARRLLLWGEAIAAQARAEVIVVDFRRSGTVQAAVVGVRSAFSIGALVAQVIAMAFNRTRAPDLESALEASGVPCTFVQAAFFERSRTGVHCRGAEGREFHRGEAVATVVANDGRGDEVTEPLSNHRVVKILSRITRRPIVYVDVPENIARQSMQQLGLPASLAEGLLASARPLTVERRDRGSPT